MIVTLYIPSHFGAHLCKAVHLSRSWLSVTLLPVRQTFISTFIFSIRSQWNIWLTVPFVNVLWSEIRTVWFHLNGPCFLLLRLFAYYSSFCCHEHYCSDQTIICIIIRNVKLKSAKERKTPAGSLREITFIAWSFCELVGVKWQNIETGKFYF